MAILLGRWDNEDGENNRPTRLDEPFRGLGNILRVNVDRMSDMLSTSLPPRRGTDHAIELIQGEKPSTRMPYILLGDEVVELKRQLVELLATGYIHLVQSPYNALVLFQNNKDSSLRLCIDYRPLNNLIVKNKYPLCWINDCFVRLVGAKYFSKLDLKRGYY